LTEEFLELDSDDIRYIHDDQIEEYGGVYGEHEPGFINLTAEKPFMTLFGEVKYPSIFQKAAVYIDSFAKNQYFVDGNKRTGVKCALTFLAINGYDLTVDDYDLFKFTVAVAESSDPTNDYDEITLDEIAEWLEDNSILNYSYW